MAVYFYGCVSLDGYLATKEHDLSWLYDTGTTADTGYEAFYEQMDMTLMGRRTFDEVATLAVPAEAYPTTDNVVFTHQALDCEGFRAVCADPVAFVKAQDGAKNIWVVGGNTILAPLLDADLVDVLIIQVAPVLLGAGIPLFAQKEALHRFCLKRVQQYGPFAELEYGRQ